MSLEELDASPHLLGKAVRSGRVVHLVSGGHHGPVADIVPADYLQELEETIEVLADSDAVRALLDERRD